MRTKILNSGYYGLIIVFVIGLFFEYIKRRIDCRFT